MPTSEDISARVLRVMSLALKCEVTPQLQRADCASWDSLKHIEMIFAIEDELQLLFGEDELATLTSAARIIDAAQREHAA